MTSEWEKRDRDRSDRRRLALLVAVEYGIQDAVLGLGAELTGFSVNFRGADCLMTLRADFEGKLMIAFVGSDTLGDLMIKANREAAGNKLSWRADKFAGK